jgi:hypothetical protein
VPTISLVSIADGSPIIAADHRNNYSTIQGAVNGIDQLNFAPGKIFDPTKLMQLGATSGQALVWNAAAGQWQPGPAAPALVGFTIHDVIVITATGTYTVPASVLALYVECWGAGGQGGGCATGSSLGTACGSGGGSGAYSAKWLTGLAASYAVTIGAGGSTSVAGANNGQAGGDTIFGLSLVLAKGGSGGLFSPNASPCGASGGAGGLAGSGVGDVLLGGFPGLPGFCTSPLICGGNGGGNGGGAGSTLNGGTTGAGVAATGIGGGGSGVALNTINSSLKGGNGAPGLIRIWELLQS